MSSKVALVTGAGSGIGRAIAARLVADGLAVAVMDLDKDAAESACTAMGNRAFPVGGVDVSDRDQVDDAFRLVRQALGPVVVLVNNAGLTGFKPFLKITDDAWDRMMAVNLKGPFYCTQAALPDMIDAGWGRIVNISSSSAQTGQQLMTHYVTSKAGLIGFTKALALEFAPQGITANTIPPAFVDTPMLRASEERGFLGASVDEIAARNPVRRAGRPEDIAAACAFLVSEDAGYITGQVIGVNGGRVT